MIDYVDKLRARITKLDAEVEQLRAENKVLNEALEQVCLELAELRGEEE